MSWMRYPCLNWHFTYAPRLTTHRHLQYFTQWASKNLSCLFIWLSRLSCKWSLLFEVIGLFVNFLEGYKIEWIYLSWNPGWDGSGDSGHFFKRSFTTQFEIFVGLWRPKLFRSLLLLLFLIYYWLLKLIASLDQYQERERLKQRYHFFR